jgi:signal transduction histidine kinase
MEKLALSFFPLPHLINGERRPGRVGWPSQCDRCDHQCEKTGRKELSLCSYGLNYIWLEPNVLAFGFLVPSPITSAANKKMTRQNPQSMISLEEFEDIREAFRRISEDFTSDIEARKVAIIEDYRIRKGFEVDFLELLRPELQRSFSFLHDYKQFVARIRQNVNVVLEFRYPGDTIEQKLARALPSEKAIYWATVLMEEKLQTAFLLLYPERIRHEADTRFRLHGLVTKYLRIYDSAFADKNVRVRTEGESRGEIKGNPLAVSVIPHTFIDNALKYSRRNSDVTVRFVETQYEVELQVSSYGPKIEENERTRIFDLFFRGQDAIRQVEEGAGFGLYLAQFVANQMQTRVEVDQSPQMAGDRGYYTTFKVKFIRDR